MVQDGMEEVRVCPRCSRAHPVEVEICQACGEPMTTVSRVIGRQGRPNPPRWLKQARSQAAEIKAREAQASDARMERFREMERQRLVALAEASARQARKDRRLLLVTGGVLAVLILTLCITALYVFLQG